MLNVYHSILRRRLTGCSSGRRKSNCGFSKTSVGAAAQLHRWNPLRRVEYSALVTPSKS